MELSDAGNVLSSIAEMYLVFCGAGSEFIADGAVGED